MNECAEASQRFVLKKKKKILHYNKLNVIFIFLQRALAVSMF